MVGSGTIIAHTKILVNNVQVTEAHGSNNSGSKAAVSPTLVLLLQVSQEKTNKSPKGTMLTYYVHKEQLKGYTSQEKKDLSGVQNIVIQELSFILLSAS